MSYFCRYLDVHLDFSEVKFVDRTEWPSLAEEKPTLGKYCIYLSTDYFGSRQIIFGNNMNTIKMVSYKGVGE